MSRLRPSPLALSLLPVFAVIGTFSIGAIHRAATPAEIGMLEVDQPPSPTTDPIHVLQLERLLQTIKNYDRRAAEAGTGHPSHAGLADEYRLIVHETTPQSILSAGLPLDIR